MEQSTSSSRSKTESYLPTLFGPKEIEVSQVLLDIPNLIQREFPSQFHVIWGGKRKRSAIDSSPSQEEQKRPKEERENEKRPKVKVEALSPTTPFSFSPSESDEKSKLSLKKPSSRTVFPCFPVFLFSGFRLVWSFLFIFSINLLFSFDGLFFLFFFKCFLIWVSIFSEFFFTQTFCSPFNFNVLNF